MDSVVQIHRLGNSTVNMTCGRLLRDVGLWSQGEKWGIVGGDQRQKVGLGAMRPTKAIV